MGASSGGEAGRHYRVAWHDGLCLGPLDAYCALEAGTKMVWEGRVTASSAWQIEQPQLWGGEKDQGGVQGRIRVMFGEADQQPNAYLTGIFGDQTVAWRGIATVAWEGGRWGANNPNPQPWSHLVERIKQGWDNDECWYPETAAIPLVDGTSGGGSGAVGSYRWVFRLTGTSTLAPSPDGIDWTETDLLSAPYDTGSATIAFGRMLVVMHNGGTTAYADWATPNPWISGDGMGSCSLLRPRPCVAGNRLWVARGAAGYSVTDDITAGWTEVALAADLICGDDTVVARFVASDYSFHHTANGGSTWTAGTTIETSGTPGTDDYAYAMSAAGAGNGRQAVGGNDWNDHPVVWWSNDGFATKHAATLPAGMHGSVFELMHVTGDEWLAFVKGPGGGGAIGAGAILRSIDGCQTFTNVLGFSASADNVYSGNAGIDRQNLRVVAVLQTASGTEIWQSDNRTTWTQRAFSAAYPPAELYCIVPQVVGTTDSSGRYLKNPAHIILEAHTASYHSGHPIETVNLDSLTAAADWFYANDFGLGTARHPDKESPEEYIARIERVAGCSFSQSNEDGLWYLDIANGEYELETLPVLTDNDVLEFEEIATVLDDAVNSVSVKYFDPLRKEAITTRPLQAIALIAEFGENHQTYEFPEIANEAVAARVRQREGLATTTPTRAFNLVTTPKTRSWRKSTYFRLQLPKRGIADMVCIVAEGDEGKLASGACQFKATQDIYSLPSTVYDSTEPGVDTRPPQTPVPVEAQRLIEAPYIDAVAQFTPAEFAALAPDVGFAIGIAANPGGMLDFTLAVDAGAGYQTKADGDYCPSCTVPGEVSPGQITGIAIADGDLMATVEPGVLCLWDDELCRVDAIDLDAGTIDLGRGCGHTIPALHPAGSRMFFYQSGAAADSTEYTDGETIDGKLLSNTGGKRLALADADALPLTFNRRLARPYPPANVTINGQPVFEVGGGGGGGGGGSAPSTPPPLTPDGTPADTTPGPNGGFADDAPYPIPPPTTLGTDVLPGGDFGDPADLGQWRNRDGSALGAGWSLVDGKLTHLGGGVAAAYCYGARLSLPISPIPRYTVSVEMDVQCDPSVVTRVGIAWGVSTNGGAPNYVEASEAATYPAEVTVSHAWTRVVERVSMLGAGTIPVVTFMPYVEHTGALGGSLATVDNAHLVITEVPTPSTPETPDHIDFDAGLTGWTLWPDPTSANPYAPTMAVSGGELSMTVTSEYFTYRWVICDDPLVGADAIGKYIGGPLEVWCNDDGTITDATGTYTFGGAALAVATKLPGQDYIPFTAALPQRGDWTERESWVRQIQDETNAPGVTHHIAVLMRCSPGKTVKVRNIQPRVTDEVID